MYRRILIPLDGSSLAEQALPYGRLLAKALRAPVQLLKVIDLNPIELTNQGSKELYIRKLSEETSSSKTYLEAVAESFPKGQAEVSIHEGNPAEVIAHRALADKSTLIVMATHGASGIRRWLLGSVAHRLLQHSANDLLLIPVTDEGRTGGEAMLKTLILPLDGSPSAEQVLPRMEGIAKTIGFKVWLLSVYAGQPVVRNHPQTLSMNRSFHRHGGELHGYLEAKVQELKQKGLSDVSSMLRCGHAADQIVQIGGDTRGGFVAVCTQGGAGRNRWVLGSVTNHVVRHARGPVLVVRAYQPAIEQKHGTVFSKRRLRNTFRRTWHPDSYHF